MKPNSTLTFMIISALSLQVFLVGMKLIGALTWPWIGVLFPVWLPLVTCLIVFVVAFLALMGYAVYVAVIKR